MKKIAVAHRYFDAPRVYSGNATKNGAPLVVPYPWRTKSWMCHGYVVAWLASEPPPYPWRTLFLCVTGKLLPVAHRGDVRHNHLWFQITDSLRTPHLPRTLALDPLRLIFFLVAFPSRAPPASSQRPPSEATPHLRVPGQRRASWTPASPDLLLHLPGSDAGMHYRPTGGHGAFVRRQQGA